MIITDSRASVAMIVRLFTKLGASTVETVVRNDESIRYTRTGRVLDLGPVCSACSLCITAILISP